LLGYFKKVDFVPRAKFVQNKDTGAYLTDTKGEYAYIRYSSHTDDDYNQIKINTAIYNVESEMVLVFLSKCKNVKDVMTWALLTLSSIKGVVLKNSTTDKAFILESEMGEKKPTNTAVSVGLVNFRVLHRLSGCAELPVCDC
jgi:hypothetical protein